MTQDIYDAEFITIRAGAREIPAPRPAAIQPAGGAESVREEQIGLLKETAGADLRPGRRAQAIYAATVACAAFAAFMISGGHVLLRGLPLDADAGRLALELRRDAATVSDRAGTDVVTVSATIRNNTEHKERVPDVLLTFEAGGARQKLVYRVARGETLSPGKSLAFTVRMPKKPGYASAPSLKFANNGV